MQMCVCVALFDSIETSGEALTVGWRAECDGHPLSQDCAMTGGGLGLTSYCTLQSYKSQASF